MPPALIAERVAFFKLVEIVLKRGHNLLLSDRGVHQVFYCFEVRVFFQVV
jgi:hypothetical protein